MSGDIDAEEDLRITLIDFSSRRHSLIVEVLRAISDAIEHVKISIIMPRMLENPEILIKKLTYTRFEPAIKLVSDFLKRREIILKEHRPPLMDHGMIKIIDYFHKNVEMFVLLQAYMYDISNYDRSLLYTFEMLFKTATNHLNREAIKQISEERRLFKLYKESMLIKKHIIKLKGKIAAYKNTLRWRMAAKAVFVQKLKRDMQEKKLVLENKIANEVDKNQRIARNYKKINLEKQSQLEQEIDKARAECNKQIKQNKIFEKQNREEKNKYLLQLQSIVKKYDTVMKEKLTENLELEEKLQNAEEKLAEFMITYQKEHKIYYEIVLKREQREENEKQTKILKYMMNRAARIIQKYWRKWQKEHKKRMKARRGKKKK